MLLFYIISGGFCLLLGLYFSWLHIKRLYREYDRVETLKEEIEQQRYLIKGAMSYIRDQYDNDFESSAYHNIKTKVDFLKPIIERRPLEKRLYYYRKLYERLYETVYRLKKDYYNVQSIMAPLKTLIDEIVEEQIDYIRENSEII